MKITLNNILKEIPNDSALPEVLSNLVSSDTKGIAVAVNNNVVPKVKWNDYTLHNGDKITIIKATQGG